MPILDPYIALRLTLRDHPKVRKAAAALGVDPPHLGGCLVWLWIWATSFTPDGDLSHMTDGEIAEAAGWTGDPARFVEALVEAKGPSSHALIDLIDGRRLIHDWDEHAGGLIDIRARNREAQRKRRARMAQELAANSPQLPPNSPLIRAHSAPITPVISPQLPSSERQMTSSDANSAPNGVNYGPIPELRQNDRHLTLNDGHDHDRTGPEHDMTGPDRTLRHSDAPNSLTPGAPVPIGALAHRLRFPATPGTESAERSTFGSTSPPFPPRPPILSHQERLKADPAYREAYAEIEAQAQRERERQQEILADDVADLARTLGLDQKRLPPVSHEVVEADLAVARERAKPGPKPGTRRKPHQPRKDSE